MLDMKTNMLAQEKISLRITLTVPRLSLELLQVLAVESLKLLSSEDQEGTWATRLSFKSIIWMNKCNCFSSL